MPKKLFLIDAFSLIYRSYYAFVRKPRLTSRGQNTSAILGFVNTIYEIIQHERPAYMAVAFDHGRTFRHDIYPEYKTQREAQPEDIRASIPIIKEILRAWHIPSLQCEGYEADDIVGTVAMAATEPGAAGDEELEVYMVTTDKDYAQLVGERRFMYRPRQGGGFDVLGSDEVCQRYSLRRPEQVRDLLALMGDTADNFPGCRGIGEKSAAKLVCDWGDVERLIEHAADLRGAQRQRVAQGADMIRLSKNLATIRTDIAEIRSTFPELLEAMRLRPCDAPAMTLLFKRLEFGTLLNKVLGAPRGGQEGVPTVSAATTRSKAKKSKKLLITTSSQPSLFDVPADSEAEKIVESLDFGLKKWPHRYQLIDTVEGARELCDKILSAPLLCFDTETTSREPVDAELVGISLCVTPGEAWYVSVPGKMAEVVEALRPALESTASRKVGQNIKYDIQVLALNGLTVGGELCDTMIAHYLLYNEQHHGMDHMAETLLDYRTIHYDEVVPPGRTMANLYPRQIVDYSCEDSDVTLRLWQLMEPQLREREGLWQLFTEIEMPLVPVLADMELSGVAIDSGELGEVSKIFTARLLEHEERIYRLADVRFNLNSPRQVGEVLFEQMAIDDKARRTKTGQYVTSEEVLSQYAADHEVVRELLAYRSLRKLVGTYLDTLPHLVNKRTGRIHTTFNQTVTVTGRLSSSDPNLQNIPVRGQDGKEIRRCFVAAPPAGAEVREGEEWWFFSADYSQIELRVMAHMSGDEAMCRAFREGRDIHATTAATVYQKAITDVTREERSRAKRANFGLLYGISAYGLSQALGCTRTEARSLMDGFFQAFPGVEQFIKELKAKARETGYAETIMRRRRYLSDISSANGTVRSYAERNAVNAPIQGTAADIIKVAMVRVWRRLREEKLRARMVLQVHDELCFVVPADERERLEHIVLSEMQEAVALSVPLVADGGWGHNWLEAH